MAPLRHHRVILFGLSADPPTGNGGHAGIIKALLKVNELADEIRVLPVYRHPYSVRPKAKGIGFCAAFAAIDHVEIATAHFHLTKPTFIDDFWLPLFSRSAIKWRPLGIECRCVA
jgi:hypothetical protein